MSSPDEDGLPFTKSINGLRLTEPDAESQQTALAKDSRSALHTVPGEEGTTTRPVSCVLATL